MTAPTPMTHEELLELAALDALGLLDEYESALFTRSFHHAAVAVQEEIKDLQAAVVTDHALLPDVEPQSALRRQVLDGVAKAVEAESEGLAPLAMIGRGRSLGTQPAGRIGLGVSGQFYRAAAFVLAGVVLVVLYFGNQKTERSDAIKQLAIDLLAKEQIAALLYDELSEDIVTDFMEFVNDPNCEHFVLRPQSNKSKRHAVLYVDESRSVGLVVAFGLPETNLKLVAIDEDGREQVRRDFRGSAVGASTVALNGLSIAAMRGMTWQVIDIAAGTVLIEYS